jgi:signal transduction histidine kinase
VKAAAQEPLAKRRQHSLAYEWAIVTAAVTLIAFVLVAGAWTWKLDGVLYDAGLALVHKPVRDDVIIVAIDDKSIEAVGRWPWRRPTVTALLDHIATAKPKAVGVDILFAEPDYQNPENDKQLAEVLKKMPGLVLSVLSLHGRNLPPIQTIANGLRLASVDADPDADGVLRRVLLEPSSVGERFPNMALVMAQGANVAVPKLTAGEYLIPFAGKSGTIRHVSASAVLSGEIPLSTLTDKFVLVGFTGTRLADSYITPSTVQGVQMSGVEVTANTLSALLNGQNIQPLGKYSVGFISAAAMLVLLVVFYRVSPTISVSLMFATAILMPVAAIVLLGYAGIWFAPMSVAISALVSYPLWNWKRLEAICHYLDDEIVQLEKEHNNTPQALPSGTVGFADYIQNRIELIRVNIGYLRAARKFLSESLDGLPYSALIVAPDGQLVVANRQALDLCRLSKSELAEHSIAEALQNIKLAQSDWLQVVSSVLSGTALETKASDANGSEFEVALASFRNDEGLVAGLIVVIEDVTKLRQAQREREEALSFLSHDIRSPQNSILALSELQRHDKTRKTEHEFVSNVQSLAQKTMTLAEDFLQLVRADSKPLNMVEYDCASLLEDCIAEIDPQAKAKQVVIQFAEPVERVAVMADRSLLTRAIGNLLVNAIKYTPEGGRIAARCEIAGANAVCSISDNGPGIEKEYLPTLFKRFSRVHGGGAKATGAGLGLAFVDVVARRHGGVPQVDSVFGKGAMFSIVLPLAASTDSD